jgi:hypothetical protein
MKRLYFIFFILYFLSPWFAVNLHSQVNQPVSVTGHVIAEVIPVFTATETSQLNFGRFAPGSQGGEIILTPESTVSVLGSVYSAQGIHNAASFYVSGDVNATFSINLPSGPVTLTHTSSAKTMKVRDWISIPHSGFGAGLLQNGSQIVYVGATLMVGTLSDNPVGIYTGTYNITFDFN